MGFLIDGQPCYQVSGERKSRRDVARVSDSAGPPPSTAGGQIANVGKAEPDKQMAAISANRQSAIADKRRNGRNRSRARTAARVEAKTDQPKDLLFRRLLTSKET